MSFDNCEFERINTIYGPFYGEYKISKLSDICVKKTGVQTGPFGSQLHNKDYVTKGTPIVTVEHLGDNCLIHENLPRVTEKDKERLNKYILKEGDIVFSRVGSVDRRAFVKKTEDGWLFSGRCLRVRPNDICVDSKFLSYFFGLSVFKQHIRNIAVGATMPSINTKILSEIDIVYPQLKEQKSIAHILSTLDEKIEVNNQINKTLEKMAQAIFKQWFVDFDFPNEDGEPYQSSGGEMVEIELGPIPKGWAVGTLGDVLTLNYGKSLPAKIRKEGNVKVYSSAGITGLHNEALVHVPSIIVGRKGTIGTVYYSTEPCFCIDTAYYASQAECKLPLILMYQLLKEINLKQYNEDSAVPGLNRNTVYAIKIVIPPIEIQNRISVQILASYNLIFENITQSEKLSAIRDLLLPKLMTGEIRSKKP